MTWAVPTEYQQAGLRSKSAACTKKPEQQHLEAASRAVLGEVKVAAVSAIVEGKPQTEEAGDMNTKRKSSEGMDRNDEVSNCGPEAREVVNEWAVVE